MAKKRKVIYDVATEESLKKATSAISMINGKLLNKNLSITERNGYENQLKNLTTMKKTIKAAYEKAISDKFKSSVDSLLTELAAVNPSKIDLETEF